jgi:ectoine hydroxylase-related dioxygenase (phytanoyl-CoA dioxygenase family)
MENHNQHKVQQTMKTCTHALSEEQVALLPTEEDVAFYEEHGWYISKKVIPDQVIEEAIAGSQRYYRGERDMQLPVNGGYSDWKPGDGDTIRNNEYTALQSRQLRKLALHPVIGAIAARLARTKLIRLLDDQLIYKPPTGIKGESVVGWHADKAYWSNSSSNSLLTAWVPFHDCDEAIGPLAVLDGSHKWPGSQDMRLFRDQNLEEIEQRLSQEGRKVTKVVMTLKKGQISFHHCWTIHGSQPNHSKSTRLSMAVHLQDEANHYQPYRNAKGEQIHLTQDSWCRKLPNGDPDYSDPEVFPALWEE